MATEAARRRNTEWARQRRERELDQLRQTAQRCPKRYGPGVCGCLLRVGTNTFGATIVICDWCDRKKARGAYGSREQWRQSPAYRPTAIREAKRICAQPGLFESWALRVSAWQLRRIRDERVFDRTEVRRPDPATHIESKESKQ